MFELDFLYEQFKMLMNEHEHVNILNSVSESTYDITDVEQKINETVRSVDSIIRANRNKCFNKIKEQSALIESILSKYKDKALQCKPYGLQYKGFKTFSTFEDIKNCYAEACKEISEIDPEKDTEDKLKEFIEGCKSSKKIHEIKKSCQEAKCKTATKEQDKDISKEDIEEAVRFLESFNEEIKNFYNEYESVAESCNTISNRNYYGSSGSSIKLRKNAGYNHSILRGIVESEYHETLLEFYNEQAIQAKCIVFKAANYNPRNLKESAIIQDYIDSVRDFYQATK